MRPGIRCFQGPYWGVVVCVCVCVCVCLCVCVFVCVYVYVGGAAWHAVGCLHRSNRCDAHQTWRRPFCTSAIAGRGVSAQLKPIAVVCWLLSGSLTRPRQSHSISLAARHRSLGFITVSLFDSSASFRLLFSPALGIAIPGWSFGIRRRAYVLYFALVGVVTDFTFLFELCGSCAVPGGPARNIIPQLGLVWTRVSRLRE